MLMITILAIVRTISTGIFWQFSPYFYLVTSFSIADLPQRNATYIRHCYCLIRVRYLERDKIYEIFYSWDFINISSCILYLICVLNAAFQVFLLLERRPYHLLWKLIWSAKEFRLTVLMVIMFDLVLTRILVSVQMLEKKT